MFEKTGPKIVERLVHGQERVARMLHIPPNNKNRENPIKRVRTCYTCPGNPMQIIRMIWCVVVKKGKVIRRGGRK